MKPVLKILFGPPGTGKTRAAAREAVRTVDPTIATRFDQGTATDNDLVRRHRELVASGQILWVTFHPSYTYEDFVEGFRPVPGDESGGAPRYEVRPGPFLRACQHAAGPEQIGPRPGQVLTSIGGGKTYEVLRADELGWVLKVRPNRSDQVGEVQTKLAPRELVLKAIDLKLPPKIFSIPGNTVVSPSDYGLKGKPVKGSQVRREVAELLGISSSDLANSSHVAAVHTALQKGGQPQSPAPVCLVIDEINRADPSRVFGELITLLEADKRLGGPEETRVVLPYSGDSFAVPATVSIIGTMNTADRSLSALDFALRRRFSFVEIAPDSTLCPTNWGGANVQAVLEGINRRVAALRSRDHRIGHAPFMESALESERVSGGWERAPDGHLRALAWTLRTRMVPLLVEYFYDDPRKVESALGAHGKTYGTGHRPLFAPPEYKKEDIEQIGDVLEEENPMWRDPEPWWDPRFPGFSAEAFLEALTDMQ
jgi:5-methylcytosine-specific restriction enzyme B